MTFAKFVFVAAALLFHTLAYGLASVTNAEFSSESEQHSLVIEVSSKIKYTVFSLTNPGRIVIDLKKVDAQSVKKIFSAKDPGAGINGFRIGAPLPGTTRIVLDLNNNIAHIHASELSAKNGKKQILVRWEMPVLTEAKAANKNPDVQSAYKAAIPGYLREAERGNAAAQYRLGVMYANGDGVAQDYKKAVSWYRKAAEQGYALAQFNLGTKYADGQGVPQDYKEAVLWYSKAAEQGLANAQNNLGVMYYNGQFVQRDLVQAYKWVSLAGTTGDATAMENRKVAEASMTPEQIEEAKSMIRDWLLLHSAGASPVRDLKERGKAAQEYEPPTSLPPASAPYEPPGTSNLANESTARHMDTAPLQNGEEKPRMSTYRAARPNKTFVTLDNTGNKSTGMYRVGAGFQHNNLFNSEHEATFNCVVSSGHAKDINQVSGSYRLPLYATGDSIDVIAAYSGAKTGTSPIVGGFPLSFSGRGNVYGARYNHHISRSGDYTSKITAGLDYRSYYNNCMIDGTAICGASGSNLTLHPFSLTYGGTLTEPTYMADFFTSIVHNFPGGAHGSSIDFSAARAAGAKADYTLLRFNGSLAGVLPKGWQYRVAGNFQYTPDALVSYESIGLVGANAVRGFIEREVSNDKGIVANVELYTPDFSEKFQIGNGSFRLLGFFDRGRGWKVPLPGEAMAQDSVGSVGLGLRYTYNKNITAKLDLAKITTPGGNSKKGDNRGQVDVMVSW